MVTSHFQHSSPYFRRSSFWLTVYLVLGETESASLLLSLIIYFSKSYNTALLLIVFQLDRQCKACFIRLKLDVPIQ